MITTVAKSVQAFVLATIVTELTIDAAKSIYKWNNKRNAEKSWETYLENVDLPLAYDPVSMTVN